MSVSAYNFEKHKTAMVERHGHSEEYRDRAWADLTIILEAIEAEPDKRFALTVAADDALHVLLLDTAGHYLFSRAAYGRGNILTHNPYVYGTPAFSEAWQNTRVAFSKAGISLSEEYSLGDSPRSAMACYVSVTSIEEMERAA